MTTATEPRTAPAPVVIPALDRLQAALDAHQANAAPPAELAAELAASAQALIETLGLMARPAEPGTTDRGETVIINHHGVDVLVGLCSDGFMVAVDTEAMPPDLRPLAVYVDARRLATYYHLIDPNRSTWPTG